MHTYGPQKGVDNNYDIGDVNDIVPLHQRLARGAKYINSAPGPSRYRRNKCRIFFRRGVECPFGPPFSPFFNVEEEISPYRGQDFSHTPRDDNIRVLVCCTLFNNNAKDENPTKPTESLNKIQARTPLLQGGKSHGGRPNFDNTPDLDTATHFKVVPTSGRNVQPMESFYLNGPKFQANPQQKAIIQNGLSTGKAVPVSNSCGLIIIFFPETSRFSYNRMEKRIKKSFANGPTVEEDRRKVNGRKHHPGTRFGEWGYYLHHGGKGERRGFSMNCQELKLRNGKTPRFANVVLYSIHQS